jgi:mono/diheme cytochrome c family protein
MRILAAIGALAIIAALGGAVVIFSGYFNVAASVPHTPLGHWLLSTAMERSVRYHAREIEAHTPQVTPALLAKGWRHYHAHCELCHGAPGVPPRGIGQGLNPKPSDLSETAPRWTARELFWIIKHGIRMTGMPAWGVSHDEEALWALVAFVQKLPRITPEQYQQLTAAAVGHEVH